MKWTNDSYFIAWVFWFFGALCLAGSVLSFHGLGKALIVMAIWFLISALIKAANQWP